MKKTPTRTLFFPTCNWNCIPNSIMLHLISRRSHKLKKKLCIIAIWHNNYSKCSSFLPTRCKYTCRILLNQFILFLTCSRHRNLQNIRILQVSCYDFFCLIKSSANRSRIMQPFLNPNIIFFSNTPQIVCHRIIKKNQNKDLENSNILEVSDVVNKLS